MHFLHLTDSFYPRIGGVERHVLQLSREFVRRGHRVSVITRQHDPCLPRREFKDGIEVRRLPLRVSARASRPPGWARLLPHLDLLRRADLIHVHDHGAFFRWYLPFRFVLLQRPVFLTFHGHEGNFPPAARDVLARRTAALLVRGNLCVGHYIEKWYGTRSQAVVYGAVSAADDDANNAGQGQVAAVSESGSPGFPCGETNHPGQGQVAALSESVPLVFLGRLEPDTGILTFLEALSLLPRNGGTRPRLIVCGKGSLESEVRSIAARASLEVDLRGLVPDPRPCIRGSRFLLASGYLSMLEGMICRRLVFGCYDNALKHDYWRLLPGAHEMMVMGGSPEELSRRFREVLDRPELERSLVARACDFAQTQTWERLAGIYLDLYRSARG